MSQVIIHGDTVYLAGQVANKTAGGTVTEQTREILARIDQLLAEAGTDKSNVLQASILAGRYGQLCGDESGVGCVGDA